MRNGCVKFEFNNKSVYTKNYADWRRRVDQHITKQYFMS